MDNDTPKTKGNNRKERLKTICTLDTYYEANFNDYYPNKENRNRNGSINITQSRIAKDKLSGPKTHKSHNKSLSSAFVYSRVKEETPKTKVRRLMSTTNNQYERIMTQYAGNEHRLGLKKIVSELKKKLVFPSEETYQLETYKIIKKIHENCDQQYFTAKVGLSESKKYTIIKLKEGRPKDYQRQMKACREICEKLAKKDQKAFLHIHNIWKEKKSWMIATDNYLNPHWLNDTFYLFLNHFKSRLDLLNSLVTQVASIIILLNKINRTHGNISIGALYFPILRGQLKAEGNIKLGLLQKCIPIKNKQQFLKMPIMYRTPPEILNLILFQQSEPFDRDYLQQISELTEGWQVDVWALGVLILQLLNGGPLGGQGSNCSRLIELQREVLIRYSYLFNRLNHKMHLCLSNMLSFNPSNRPNPVEILQCFKL